MKQNKPNKTIRNKMDLESILEGVDLIYVYPHHQIELSDDNELEQTRSGPNWEGGMVTMATCKHFLRTYSSIKPKKVALCGITNKIEGENYLLYIGVIDKSFDSNYELGRYISSINQFAFDTKLATNNPLGDIFEPDEDLEDEERYDSLNFIEPHDDHCRFVEFSDNQPKYIKDIEYQTRSGRRPKCLILDPVTVHDTPLYTFTGKLGRASIALKGDDAAGQLMALLEETL